MSESERRTLVGVACFLLLASLVRHGLEGRTSAVDLPEDAARVPALEAEGQAMRDDEEARSRPLEPGERIDLNLAAEVDLNRLSGIGRATAEAIVEERAARGPFTSVDDLTRVRGIGPATVERVREHVEAVGRAGDGGSAVAPVLDINRASAEELVRLPGVGPAIAERIIQVRDARGGFRDAGDLEEVPGIGPATLARLRPLVVIRE